MNNDELLLLNNYKAGLSQRALSDITHFSLGKVNKLLSSLKEQGFIDTKGNLANEKVNELKVKNAIILAAGPGLRMLPISDEAPKQLLNVKGEILIERMIEQLKEKGINNIAIVVGFKKEQFEYLIDKYSVKLVVNKDYGKDSNLRSLFLAAKYIDNSYIIPGDLYFYDNPFNKYELNSYYTLSTKERMTGFFYVDKKGNLMIGKNKFYDAIGMTFINIEETCHSLFCG